jgi:hypothetical protein
MTDIVLTEFERELLERISLGGPRFGVALDCLDEELLASKPRYRPSEPNHSGISSSRCDPRG